jgi:hypothetical protein
MSVITYEIKQCQNRKTKITVSCLLLAVRQLACQIQSRPHSVRRCRRSCLRYREKLKLPFDFAFAATEFFFLPVYCNIYNIAILYVLQSVRGHSAVVMTATINGMQKIHPVIYLLFKFNHN